MQTSQNWQAELQEALALLEQNRPEDCAARLRTLLRQCENNPICRALALDGLGQVLLMQRRAGEAVAAMEESLSILRGSAGEDAPLTLGVMQHLAHVWLELGEPGKSAALGREVVQRYEKAFGADSPRLAQALFHLSATHYRQKDFDAAESCLQRARAIWETQRPLPPQLGTCFNNLGRIYEERGRIAEGIALHRKAVALRRELLGDCHADTAFSLGNLGVALATDSQWREAADTLEAAVACYARLGKYDCPDAMSYKENLALCHRVLEESGQGITASGKAAGEALSAAPLAANPSAPDAGGATDLGMNASAANASPASASLTDALVRELASIASTVIGGGGAAASCAASGARAASTGAGTEGNAAIKAPGQHDGVPGHEREALLSEIVERELVMFLATPNEGGPASCQQRPDSFRIMRRMAHEALSDATLALYLEDLRRAEREGRNFMIEKYARMENLLPPLQESPLIEEITDAEAAFSLEAAAVYPHVIQPNRQGYFRNYLRCELETLSPGTLESYAADLRRARQQGRNPMVARYERLARLLGKGSLDAMEQAARQGS